MPKIALLSAAHTHTRGFLKAIAEKDNAALVAIYDDVEDRGRRFAAEYGAEYSGSLEATLARDDVDGFIICAENTRHLPLLKAAIPVGKPIFCEKPFTTTAEDAAIAVALIRKHNTLVHLGYFQPFSAAMQGVVRHVASGALGKVTHARYRNAHHAAYGRWFDAPDVAWFANPDLAGGGAFMDMGAHAVHLLRTLLGPVESVFATISNVSGIYTGVDDNGLALLRFQNGCLATVEASWVQTGGPGGLEVTGSVATLFQHPQHGFVTVAPREEPKPVPEGQARPTRVDRLVAAIEGKIDREELEQDLRCAVDAVAIVEACYRSNRVGTWVDVPKI
ncbi:MAG: Gfo/Idh/MocA family oxidoreductase [Candidatus Latescibacteria bacterium]|nr:Gfo/Idh/MocA family oxidoreductase [Candidatus Latescibacterota bacterium]